MPAPTFGLAYAPIVWVTLTDSPPAIPVSMKLLAVSVAVVVPSVILTTGPASATVSVAGVITPLLLLKYVTA